MRPDLKIMTRDEAHDKGHLFFFTGRTCRKGHLSERYVSSGNCKACQNYRRKPAASAPNAFMPPSPYIFAGWIKMTPRLLSAIHGHILNDLPNITNHCERQLKEYLPLQPPYRLTAKAIAEGQTRETLVAGGWNDLDLLKSGYVELGPFRNWGTVKT